MFRFRTMFTTINVFFLIDFLAIRTEPQYTNGIKISLLSTDSHILIHDLGKRIPEIKEIIIRDENQLSVINISLNEQINVQMRLRIRNAVDQFKEAPHSFDDNQFVLQSHPQSDIFHLMKPMAHIINNYCMRPLPKRYIIIKESYKNRATMAYPAMCNEQKVTDEFQRACLYKGQVHYQRSVNDKCKWKKHTGVVYLDEEIQHLKHNLNSLFCMDPSPLLSQVLQHKVKENERMVFDPGCEYARARCIDCQVLQCKSNAGKSCCKTTSSCLLNEKCLRFYDVECDGSFHHNGNMTGPTCLRGNTYKLTLTPEFDFDRRNFLCHLQKRRQVPSVLGEVTLMGLPNGPHQDTKVTFNRSFTDGNMSIAPNFNLMLIPSSINDMGDVIFERRGYAHFLNSLKTREQFDRSAPRVHEHFSRNYVRVQFEAPFLYTTSTWSQQTFNMNASRIHSAQTLHNQNSTVPVRLTNKPVKHISSNGIEQFHYNILPVVLSPAKIRVQLQDKSSILSLLFCDPNGRHAPSNVALEIEAKEDNIWILHVRAHCINQLSFLTISIFLANLNVEPVYHSKVVVTEDRETKKSVRNVLFSLSITVNESIHSIAHLQVVIYHCQKMLHKEYFFLKTNLQAQLRPQNEEFDEPEDISNAMLTFFISILSACCLYFLFLAFQALRTSSNTPVAKLKVPLSTLPKKLNYRRLSKAIIYLTIKLFYTVSFTLTLVLSVCLSLNSSSTSFHDRSPCQVAFHAQKLPLRRQQPDISCKPHRDQVPSDFLEKVAKVLSNNEEIRTNSLQSTKEVATSIVLENVSKQTEASLNKMTTSLKNSVERNLGDLLGRYVNLHDQVKYTKFLQILRSWNHSIVTVASNLLLKDSYLDTYNLLKTFEGRKSLENCGIFRQKISKLKHLYNITMDVMALKKRPILDIRTGHYHRHFISHYSHDPYFVTLRKIYDRKIEQPPDFSVSVIKIRIIFMLIDVVLLVYRFYWTFIDIQQVWRSKKEIIQLDKIKMKDGILKQDRSRSSGIRWTQVHHVEFLVSGHLAVAAIIIIVSIICTILIVLLTSKEHANWLSNKSGNIIRIRSFNVLKDRLSHINSITINPIQRHLEYLKIIKVKEIMSYRVLSSMRMMNLELFFNKIYFSELCHLQKETSPRLKLIDFCTSIMPNEKIIPRHLCYGSIPSPAFLSNNFTDLCLQKTVQSVNTFVHLSVNVLAVAILTAAIIGMYKIFREQFGSSILNSENSTYTVYIQQHHYLKYFTSTFRMKVPVHISRIYNTTFDLHHQYHCLTRTTLNKNDPLL